EGRARATGHREPGHEREGLASRCGVPPFLRHDALRARTHLSAVGHCNRSRGAGTFGGWPDTRRASPALVMALPIPPAGGAGTLGGWPDTRRASPALVMALPIPPAGGAGTFGGWPDPRRASPALVMALPLPPPGGAGPLGGRPDPPRPSPRALR